MRALLPRCCAAGEAASDPKRPFATLNCRTAKVSFTAPLATIACRRGWSTARLSHWGTFKVVRRSFRPGQFSQFSWSKSSSV
jgi:hypothetical protein